MTKSRAEQNALRRARFASATTQVVAKAICLVQTGAETDWRCWVAEAKTALAAYKAILAAKSIAIKATQKKLGRGWIKRTPIEERIRKNAVRDSETGCLIWNGWKDKGGYTRISVPNPNGKGHRLRMAHRVAYEIAKGPIPEGFEIDHLCKNRACIEPSHLEAVTPIVNVERSDAGLRNRIKTVCCRGHAFDEVNTLWITCASGKKERQCRACNRERTRLRRAA